MMSERVWRAPGDNPVKYYNGFPEFQTASRRHHPRQPVPDHRSLKIPSPLQWNHRSLIILSQGASNYGRKNPARNPSRRTATYPNSIPLQQRPAVERVGGNRGEPNLFWRSGPRESSRLSGGASKNVAFSLFVDCIPPGVSSTWLRTFFNRAGKVVDAFVSRKVRKARSDPFGFVRFNKLQEAMNAINMFDGCIIQGAKLRVSMAKYNKGGSTVSIHKPGVEKQNARSRKIINPAFHMEKLKVQ